MNRKAQEFPLGFGHGSSLCFELTRRCLRAPNRPPLSLVVALIALAACDAGPDRGYDAAPLAGKDAPLSVTDPAIDPTDTWIAAHVTVEHRGTLQAPTPMVDAADGQTKSTMILDEPAARYRVEAGYDGAGALVLTQTRLDPEGDPLTDLVDPIREVRLDNGSLSVMGQDETEDYGTAPGFGPSLRQIVDDPGDAAQQLFGGVFTRTMPKVGDVETGENGSMTVRHVVSAGGRTTVHAAVTSPEYGASTMRRVYRNPAEDDSFGRSSTFVVDVRRGMFVLERVEVDATIEQDGFDLAGMSVVTFSDVGWNRNQPRDQARGTETWGSESSNIDTWEPPMCQPGEEGEEDRGTNGCTTDGNPTPGTPGPSTPPPCAHVPGGANLVFVHGFNADGDGWGGATSRDGLRGKARCEFQVASDAAPTYGDEGLASHATQTTELRSDIQGLGIDDNILVAHSQGGVISRRVRQSLPNGSQLIRGLVTIGTPHQGAYVAGNLPSNPVEGALDAAQRQIACRIFGGGCSMVRTAIQSLVSLGSLTQGMGSAASDDLRVGSAALQQVNSAPEPASFQRYGIQHYVSKRWSFFRLAGDLGGKGPEVVGYIDLGMAAVATATVISLIGLNWLAARRLVRFIYEFVMFDRWWNRITAGGDRSDGFIQGSSQVYPGALLNRAARKPTSHTGERKTNRSYRELKILLEENLGVQPRD